jgi:hypothetical protein
MNGNASFEKSPPARFHPAVFIWFCIWFLILACGPRPAPGEEETLLLGFRQAKDPDSLPEEWELLTYRGTPENEISLEEEDTKAVLRVKSLGSASALLKRLDVDLKEWPILVWSWRINRIVGMAMENRKDRNDSAARVRVIFGEGGERPQPLPPQLEEFFKSLGIERPVTEPRGFKIDYIWGTRLAPGEVIDYPGSRNHKIVAVESGKARVNRWVSEKRNLIEDYEQFFEAAPPGLLGIVILTDTDQTNEGVEAWYTHVALIRD